MGILVALGLGLGLGAMGGVALGSPAVAADKVVQVGLYENAPKVFTNAQGEPAGFWVDLLAAIAASEDWILEYEPCHWEQCLQALAAGQIDLMVDVAYSEDRDRPLDFNQEVVLASWSIVYARPGLPLTTLLDLDQRRVAVLTGSIQAVSLAEQTEAFGVHPQFVPVNDFADILTLLDQGAVDAAVVNRFWGAQQAAAHGLERTPILVHPSRLHFAVADGDPASLLPPLDRHLRQLMGQADSAYYQALARWLQPRPRFGWSQLRQIGLHLAIYGPLLGLVGLLLWNRALRQEVERRQRAEAENRAILSVLPDFMFRVGADGVYRGFVTSQRDFSLVKEVETRNQTMEAVLAPDVAARQYHYLRRVLDTGQVQVYEQTIQHQGHLQQEEVRVVKCGPDEALFMVRDISDRKRAEAQLRESEQRFRSAIDNAPFPIMIHAEDGTVLQINSAWTELTGYTPADIPTLEAWTARAYGVRKDRMKRDIDRLYQLSSRVDEGEYTITTRDGSQRTWQFSSAPLGQQADGRRVVISMAVDITQRQQVEVALRQSEQRFRNMAANVPGVILRYVRRPHGHEQVIYLSPGCYDLWEVEAEAVLADAGLLWSMVDPADQAALDFSIQESARTGQPWCWQWRITTPSGQRKWLEAAGRPERQSNGDVVWDTLVLDVTERRQAQVDLEKSEVRYRKVVEAQTDFILRSRPDTTITFANPALCRVLGVSLEALIGRKWSDFAHPEDLEAGAFAAMAQLTPENPRCFVANRDTRADGQVGWTQWLNEGIFDETGQLIEIQSVGRDITDLKRVEAALRQSEERLRLVTETMGDLVCLHDANGRYLYITPSSQALLGYAPGELLGRTPDEFCHPDDLAALHRHIQTLALAGQALPVTYRFRRKQGDYIWLETLTQPIGDDAHQVIHLQTTSRNVSDRVRIEAQLKYDACHDSLTGLPNRHLLIDRLNQAIQRVQATPNAAFAVLFFDLDNFKVVNDSLGHHVGDELLVQVATLLPQFIRETDLAARLGGDEFVILLETVTGIPDAVAVAERILADLRSPLTVAQREVFISTSIGIALGAAHYTTAAEILRDADLAMYRAKQSGREQYAVFDPAMHFQVVQRLHLENDLRRALEQQAFTLHFQPIVDLKTLRIQGFEALLRWQHPQRGLVMPGSFIPVAEDMGLIVPLGAWVLQTACAQLAQWQRQFPQRSPKLSVNLSVGQLHPHLLAHLDTALAESGLQPQGLVLEITESMLVSNLEVTGALLQAIRARGVGLSIDDFGTGYSSLSYLHQLPVDALKIDRAFVSPAAADVRNQVIAELIISLSNLLELDAIAEGVETLDQLRWLQSLGCEWGQGNLFSQAVPAAEATALWQQAIVPVPGQEG